MAKLTRAEFLSELNERIPDNNTRRITPADHRSVERDLAESAVWHDEVGTAAEKDAEDFAAAEHEHTLADITDAGTAARADTGDFAQTQHTHAMEDVSGLDAALGEKVDSSVLDDEVFDAMAEALSAGSNITLTPNAGERKITIAAAGGGEDASVSDAPYGSAWDGDTTNAPSKNAVYDKIEALDDQKADTAGLGTAASMDSDAFAKAAHTHAMEDVTGLDGALSAKADAASLGSAAEADAADFAPAQHGHPATDITGLGSAATEDAGAFASAQHNHSLSDITDAGSAAGKDAGEFASAIHNHTLSDISDAGTAAAEDASAFAKAEHTHATGDITGLTSMIENVVASFLQAGDNVTLTEQGGKLVISSTGGPGPDPDPEVTFDDSDTETVAWMWTGAQSEDGIVVSAEIDAADGTGARLAVSPHADFSADVQFGPEVEVENGLAKLTAEGLDGDSEYHCAVRVGDTVYIAEPGKFRTLPQAGQFKSFTLAFGSCSKTGYEETSFKRIQARDPLAFVHLGDWLYPDYTGSDKNVWIGEITEAFSGTDRREMHRKVPTYYMWDDHDFGANNSYGLEEDGTPVNYRQSRLDGYRGLVPHPSLASTDGDDAIYFHIDFGRVRLVVCDGRSTRHKPTRTDDAGKSMLGADQKAWLKGQFDWLANNPDRAMIWANTMPWIHSAAAGQDTWAGFDTERQELVDYFTGETGPADVSGRIVMISGDAHMLAYDNGNNAPGGIRVCHAAPLGTATYEKGGPYSGGKVSSSNYQYGVITFAEADGKITFDFKGYDAVTDTESIGSGVTTLEDRGPAPEPSVVFVESFGDDSDIPNWVFKDGGGDDVPHEWKPDIQLDGDPIKGALRFGGEGYDYASATRTVSVSPGSTYVAKGVGRHVISGSGPQCRHGVILLDAAGSKIWSRDESAGSNEDRTITIDVFDGDPLPPEASSVEIYYEMRGSGAAGRWVDIGHIELIATPPD